MTGRPGMDAPPLRIAHVINPVVPAPGSDLAIAQPITLESMLQAKAFAKDVADVELYAVSMRGETVDLPPDFHRLRDLDRCVADMAEFAVPRRLPLIADILSRLSEGCDADFCIYTNVDIALQPFFYRLVAHIVAQGTDAFVINRRTISERFTSPEALPWMCAELGATHAGYDCFVFRPSALRSFVLGNVCIGMGWIGRALVANLVAHAESFEAFTDLHATFHVGNARAWNGSKWHDYWEHNMQEFEKILMHCRFGPRGEHPLLQDFREFLDETRRARAEATVAHVAGVKSKRRWPWPWRAAMKRPSRLSAP